jgi:flagellar hook-associated protein 1 FlgK
MTASLNGILSIAASALRTNQIGLNTVSDNVSNVNTPGYVRKQINQTSLVYGGVGQGVAVASVTRAADAYLQQATLAATATAANAGAIANNLDQAQTLFGDPASSGSLFDRLDSIFSALSSLANAPTSVGQSQSLSAMSQFFAQATQISSSLTTLQSQTDSKIAADVSQVNDLLKQIDALNTDISRGSVTGNDITGYQNQQSQYIDKLSKLIDIKVSPSSTLGAGVTIRAADGTPLNGGGRGPAVFSYDQTNGNGQLFFTPPGGSTQPYGSRLTSGEVEGLLHARNTDLPNLSEQLGEFTSGVASALNAVSNTHSATPAPSALTGRDTGIDVPSAIAGFTGKTNIAIVNSSGVIQQKVAIDFSAGTMSVNGGAATAFTAANFVSSLNTALAPAGGASLNGNVLSLTAAGANGVAIGEDATTPSTAGGKTFGAYFGLNDIVSSKGPPDYNTGLSGSSLSGFNSGQIKFRLSAADGSDVADITVAPTAGQTLSQMVTQLNSPSSGLGLYGSFSLNSFGAISFSPNAGSTNTLHVVADSTSRNGTGPSFTTLFGVEPTLRAGRASNFSISNTLLQQPSLLPNAALNTTAAVSTIGLAVGDTRGTDALAQVGQTVRQFSAAGGTASQRVSLSDYSANFSARIATAASDSATAQKAAEANATQATARRSASEGVNLDEELISLTTYQQAYNASARLVSSAKDMYDTLLGLVK